MLKTPNFGDFMIFNYSIIEITKRRGVRMKKTAEEVLLDMIDLFICYLTELNGARADAQESQFAYGEKTAYVECLELISQWKKAEKHGLDFCIEERFPL